MYIRENDEVLTPNEAMDYLKISKATFLKYVRLGRIKVIKAWKECKLFHSELNRFLRGDTD